MATFNSTTRAGHAPRRAAHLDRPLPLVAVLAIAAFWLWRHDLCVVTTVQGGDPDTQHVSGRHRGSKPDQAEHATIARVPRGTRTTMRNATNRRPPAARSPEPADMRPHAAGDRRSAMTAGTRRSHGGT